MQEPTFNAFQASASIEFVARKETRLLTAAVRVFVLASNVVGLAMLAVVGIGWVGGGGNRTQQVFARIYEAPVGSYFSLTDASGRSVAEPEPKLYGALSSAFADAAADTLLRRVLFGWNQPPHALHALPVATVEQRVVALLGRGDAGVFLRRDGLSGG